MLLRTKYKMQVTFLNDVHGNEIQYCHGGKIIQKEEESFDQEI